MSDSAHRHLLPRSIDALKCCQQRLHVAGDVALASLSRLLPVLHVADGFAHADLQFGVDEQARKVVHGTVRAALTLGCQRCLGQVVETVVTELSLALVWSDEQAAHLPRSLDPVLVAGGEIDLYAVVEEELLLALPLVAQHPEGECEAPAFDSPVDLLPEPDEAEARKNPFQVLASLKLAGKPPQTDD